MLTYQNELFDAREENIRKRREEPEQAAAVSGRGGCDVTAMVRAHH